jgi:hypothetical protein
MLSGDSLRDVGAFGRICITAGGFAASMSACIMGADALYTRLTAKAVTARQMNVVKFVKLPALMAVSMPLLVFGIVGSLRAGMSFEQHFERRAWIAYNAAERDRREKKPTSS